MIGPLGQDGSYLVEQLSAEGHEVWGMSRRFVVASPARLIPGDLLDQESIEHALTLCSPDMVFNVAAVTAPGAGWGMRQPALLAETTGLGVLHLLDAMLGYAPEAKLVHASSSAIYDLPRYGPYGLAKRFAHDAVVGYRGKLWASNAVLYSHTSPRQDPRFLARRICTAAARGERMTLGDVESRRDWGYAPDYCDAMRLIAEQGEPGDWVVSTGSQRSVRELAVAAANLSGRRWSDVFGVDPSAPRVPDEEIAVQHRHAGELGWTPQHSFAKMISILVEAAK